MATNDSAALKFSYFPGSGWAFWGVAIFVADWFGGIERAARDLGVENLDVFGSVAFAAATGLIVLGLRRVTTEFITESALMVRRMSIAGIPVSRDEVAYADIRVVDFHHPQGDSLISSSPIIPETTFGRFPTRNRARWPGLAAFDGYSIRIDTEDHRRFEVARSHSDTLYETAVAIARETGSRVG